MKKTLTLAMFWLFCSSLNAQLVINEIFYNSPDNGADSLEFIEIINADPFDASLAGYLMTEGIVFEFPDVIIPAGGLFVMTNDSLLMVDSFGINAWQWSPTENLSNAGEAIVLKDPFGSTVDSLFYDDAFPWPEPADGNGFSMELCDVFSDNTQGVSWFKSDTETGVILNNVTLKCTPGTQNTVCSPYTGQLIITEIMYNLPGSDDPDSLEYIELYNAGDESIYMEGFFVSEGFTFDFPDEEIDPGDFILLASDADAVRNTFGIPNSVEVWEYQGGNLSNSQEEDIVIRDQNGYLIDHVRYEQEAPYSPLADGGGFSLELCDFSSDNLLPMNWKPSKQYANLVISNKTIFCTPAAQNSVDCTTADHIVQVLDNSFDEEITIITEGETVLWQNAGAGIHNVNGLQSIYPGNFESFLSGDPYPGPWNYTYTFNTVGTYDYRCDLHFQQGMTGKVIVQPAPYKDIVITEILYHQPGGENGYDFVEFYNRSNNIIDLGDYFFAEGVEYEFPNIGMDPGEYLVVTKDAEAFHDAFGVDAFEWTNGGLNNNGESITLSSGVELIDIVEFDDDAPWPEIADGEGASIMLCDINSDNNNPFNWRFSTSETNVATSTNPNLFIHATPGAANDSCSQVPYIFFGENIPVEVPEDIDTLKVQFKMANLGTGIEGFIDVVVESSSTAQEGVDFSIPEFTVDFDAGEFGEVTIGRLNILIVDDLIQEFTEKIVIRLTNPVGANLASTGLATIDIIDNDGFNPGLYPEHTIGEVTTVDNEFITDSLGIYCALRGVVYGYNIHPDGLEFTLIDKDDKEDGIRVFRNNNPSTYLVTEGDEVSVYGFITQYNGLTQIIPDNIEMHSAGNALFAADTITSPLSELEESKLIAIKGLTRPNGSNQNVGDARHYLLVADNGVQYLMRVDDDTDVPETIDLPEYFNATGIGSQIDPGSSPYNVGYMFMPRYKEDIEEIVATAEPAILKVMLYPNPAKEQLIVSSDVPVEKMIVYNLLGQPQIIQMTNDVKTLLDVSTLTPGYYLLTCIHQNKMRTVKFIKE